MVEQHGDPLKWNLCRTTRIWWRGGVGDGGRGLSQKRNSIGFFRPDWPGPVQNYTWACWLKSKARVPKSADASVSQCVRANTVHSWWYSHTRTDSAHLYILLLLIFVWTWASGHVICVQRNACVHTMNLYVGGDWCENCRAWHLRLSNFLLIQRSYFFIFKKWI